MVRRDGKMNLASCVGLILGACIGSALFSISGITVLIAGGSAVVSWIVAAVIACSYGIILAELAVRHKESGGVYSFPRHAIGGVSGRFLGFVSGWGYILSNIIAIGFSAIYCGVYLNACIPSINAKAVSVTVMLAALGVTWFSGHRSQKLQDAMVVFLVITILAFCACCIGSRSFDPSNFHRFFTSGTGGGSGFISAIPLALVAYGASVVIPFMASEVKNPGRNIPLSLFIGLGALALVYSIVVCSVVGTVPVATLKSDESLRYIPLHAAAMAVTDSFWLSALVSICAEIALFTTIIALMRVNSRAMRTMAEEGFLPDCFSKTNSHGAPGAAFILLAASGTAMCFTPKFTISLINLGAALSIATMAISCVSLIVSRKKFSTEGFKAPLGNFLPVAVITIFAACYVPDIIKGGRHLLLFTAISYLVGIAVYLAGRGRADRRICGVIVHGKGHAHRHGMPTANLQPFPGQAKPENGVWRTKVFIGGDILDGLTHIGLRPTDDDSGTPTIETWIPGFEGNLYEMRMTLQFCRYIRPTRKFDSLDELRDQLKKDWES